MKSYTFAIFYLFLSAQAFGHGHCNPDIFDSNNPPPIPSDCKTHWKPLSKAVESILKCGDFLTTKGALEIQKETLRRDYQGQKGGISKIIKIELNQKDTEISNLKNQYDNCMKTISGR